MTGTSFGSRSTRLTLAMVPVLMAGCSGPDAPTDLPRTVAPSPTSVATSHGPATTAASQVIAELDDFTIRLSPSAFSAGPHTFVAEQVGQSPHALAIKGPGVDTATETIAAGGASQQLTVSLQPGTYELWCPVGSHRAQGMTITVNVA